MSNSLAQIVLKNFSFVGSQEESASTQNPNACGEQSVSGMAGRERIKILKGFVAKESVKGHMASSNLTPLGTISV